MRFFESRLARAGALVVWISSLGAACGEDFSAGSPSSDAGQAGAEASMPEGGSDDAGGAVHSAGNSSTPIGGHDGSSAGAGDAAGGAAGAATRSPYRDGVLADEPLVYWRMGSISNQVVPDETGGGNDLVLQGDGATLQPLGATSDDAAVEFDGAEAFAIATDSRALDFPASAPFTLECWALRRTGGTSYFQHLISNVQGVAGNRDGYSLYLLPEPANADASRSVFEYNRPQADLGIWGPMPAAGKWAHYATTFDGKQITLYVDGTLASSEAVGGSVATRNNPFTLARASGVNGSYFKGALDEVAVYPRALGVAALKRHIALAR